MLIKIRHLVYTLNPKHFVNAIDLLLFQKEKLKNDVKYILLLRNILNPEHIDEKLHQKQQQVETREICKSPGLRRFLTINSIW